ncbi:MAG: UDP-N-acetylmuramate dehydrogenase [Acidobacteriota bacterium]|nr:UDP-N-acetylmuramate dehydrogenase [Acidobacteriota bacterium]
MTGAPDARFDAALVEAFGRARVGRDVPLASFTTFKVGGPADWLVEAHGAEEVRRALTLAHEAGQSVTILGGGSNVLIGDRGIRGLVIRPRGGAIVEEGPGRVRADAAVTINGLVRWTVGRGLAGLEAWAGTPGTVGGGIHGNAHYGGRLLGELVAEVRLVDREGAVKDVPQSAMEFGYDRSRLQRTGEVLLSAVFRVGAGDPEQLRAVARQSLAFRKRTQPLDSPSAGCIFQNPDPGIDRLPEGMPASAGALVDRAGLKGRTMGGARVSPTHGNFIVNDGQARAADIRALVELCRREVQARFGVVLRDEIVCLGEF